MNIGRYELKSQKNVETFGVRYEAYDPENKREVELRIIHKKQFTRRRWKFLNKQIAMTWILDHPMVAKIYENALDNESQSFIVLEMIKAPSLADIDFQQQSISQKLSIITNLAIVLKEAHCMGLTHGQLCLSEVFVEKEKIKLDFSHIRLRKITKAIDIACYAPEKLKVSAMDMAADIYGLGALIFWLITNKALYSTKNEFVPFFTSKLIENTGSFIPDDKITDIVKLLEQMLETAPSKRPLASQIEKVFAPFLQRSKINTANDTVVHEEPKSSPSDTTVQEKKAKAKRIGRFEIISKLGAGGMGEVYKACDVVDQKIVAIKTLSSKWGDDQDAVARFFKEARMLSELNNPYVSNLIEANEDNGVYYLAMEYVPGKNLETLLRTHGNLDVKHSLAIITDVARALLEAHEREIVHRDIKPANIIMVGEFKETETPKEDTPYAKLSDFGLARHVVETDSLKLTQAGTILGTPLYMAPEQWMGTDVDSRTDIYALGATLFHLLTGEPPFISDNPLAIMNMHQNEPAPPIQEYNENFSDDIARVVAKSLNKAPNERYASAREMLDDMESILKGDPIGISLHPTLPKDNANMIVFELQMSLDSSPQQLWPHVANTERLNRALGLPPVEYTTKVDPEKGVRRFGKTRDVGLLMEWEEHPFEWIEGQRMGVLREYTKGPLKWLASVVETKRHPEGTALFHTIQMVPKNVFGKTIVSMRTNMQVRKALKKIYKQIDSFIQTSSSTFDPFEKPKKIPAAQMRKLQTLLEKLQKHKITKDLIQKLKQFITFAPEQEIARIRPLALARKLNHPPQELIKACFYGASEGLFTMLWDILCPICRIPSQLKETLQSLENHGYCEACDLDFKLDFANSVEMIFRVAPEIRESELKTYCIGGPGHSPHVVAQIRIKPQERFQLKLHLAEGSYRLRGPQLSYELDFDVELSAPLQQWNISLSSGLAPEIPRALKPEKQTLFLTNNTNRERLVRIEHIAARKDSLTAARVSSMPLFRELFPEEILSDGQLVSISTMTFLTTSIEHDSVYKNKSDAESFSLVYKHFRLLEKEIKEHQGVIIKTIGETVFSTFAETIDAVKVGFSLQKILTECEQTKDLKIKIAIHRGPAVIATINNELDYFGSTIRETRQMLELCSGGELVLSHEIAIDPNAAKIKQEADVEGKILRANLSGASENFLLKIKL